MISLAPFVPLCGYKTNVLPAQHAHEEPGDASGNRSERGTFFASGHRTNGCGDPRRRGYHQRFSLPGLTFAATP